MARLPECVVVADGAEFVLLGRHARVEHARGTEAELRALAVGRYDVTDAPMLGPVEFEGITFPNNLAFRQLVDETKPFRGRSFTAGIDEWTGGVLYPDYLGVSFTERLADVPMFVAGVERIAGGRVGSVRGVASVAGAGDASLLGDWIRSGRFQPERLAARFAEVLGGEWVVTVFPRSAGGDDYNIHFDRLAGS